MDTITITPRKLHTSNSTTGITRAAGNRRRAMTPPAPGLVNVAISPRSGRAHRTPRLSSPNTRAVLSAIGM